MGVNERSVLVMLIVRMQRRMLVENPLAMHQLMQLIVRRF